MQSYRNANVLNYLEDIAQKMPDKLAIVDKDSSYTFSQVIDLARRIGTQLAKRINGTNQAIFVSTDRSARSLIAYFGALYSGNYYVPVDVITPLERLSMMLSTIKPAAFINFGQDKSIDNLSEESKSNTMFVSYEEAIQEEPNIIILTSIRQDKLDIDPCYVLFTSGSTGVPKGVVISHCMVVDLTEWLNSITNISSSDNIGNQTPFFFDASVKDIYQMLKTGATLYIIPTQYFMFPSRLIDYLNDNKISVILWASSAISMTANSGIFGLKQPQFLKLLTFAGEKLHAKQLNIWRKACPNLSLVNLYGPTEITVDCAYFIVDREFRDEEEIPIGKACLNKELLMLNEENDIITEGSGELCVRGSGVALGYFGDKDRTDEVFIQNPQHNLYRDIIYKTGDIVRLSEDGNYIFLSRKDNQVKRKGHRIELGEIETALNSVPDLEENAVIYHEDTEDLIVFYTGKDLMPKNILRYIYSALPKYMLPTKYLYLEAFPYTRNGKIDRIALYEHYLTVKYDE